MNKRRSGKGFLLQIMRTTNFNIHMRRCRSHPAYQSGVHLRQDSLNKRRGHISSILFTYYCRNSNNNNVLEYFLSWHCSFFILPFKKECLIKYNVLKSKLILCFVYFFAGSMLPMFQANELFLFASSKVNEGMFRCCQDWFCFNPGEKGGPFYSLRQLHVKS